MDHIPDEVNVEAEVNIVGKLYHQIDELLSCFNTSEPAYMDINYQKWIVNTKKLVNHILLHDISDNISATAN